MILLAGLAKIGELWAAMGIWRCEMQFSGVAIGAQRNTRVEWPTVTLAVVVYGTFLLSTWHHAAVPWWLLVPLGTIVVTLQGSLQHEIIHGHPTGWRRVNELMAKPALWLWLPYAVYRELHLKHHNNAHLTDPLDDPESYYLTGIGWGALAPRMRVILVANQTLAGRLTVGALLAVVGLWRHEWRRIAGGDRRRLHLWLEHLGWVALILLWVGGVCGMPIWQYVLCFAFPGTALTMLRSYMEHRPAPAPGARCAIVEASPFFSLLFLNNNLHAVHHRWPGIAWYRLPRLWRTRRREILRWNGGYLIGGYGAIARRFLLRPKDHPIHPDYPC